jgi:hypothetical protein
MSNANAPPRLGNHITEEGESSKFDVASLIRENAILIRENAILMRKKDENAILIRENAILMRKTAILEGEFYTKTCEVWGEKLQDFRGAFEMLRRPEGYYKNNDSYNDIVSAVTNPEETLAPRLDSVSRSTKTRADRTRQNFLGTDHCEVAHQGFPNSPTCILAYGIISQVILGFDAEVYCASMNKNKDETIKLLQHLVCGNESNGRLGLRSVPENKLLMPKGHCEHYDNNPHWIIVPIMTTEEIKKWKTGEKYFVMVLAKDAAEYKTLITEDYHDSVDGIRQRCSEEDVKVATQLLGDFMKANADALLGRPKQEESNVPTSNVTPLDLFQNPKDSREVTKKINNLGITEKLLSKKFEVKVPKMKSWDKKWEILKVHISGTGIHSVPDPATIAEKAAINVSSLYDQKLLPACPVVEVEEENPMDALADAIAESGRIQRKFTGTWVSGSDALDNESLSDNEEEFPGIDISGSDGWDNESLSSNEEEFPDITSYVCPDDYVEDSEPRRVSLD